MAGTPMKILEHILDTKIDKENDSNGICKYKYN